jgi:hypothetical protein
MTYPDAIRFLYDLRLFGTKPGLGNTFKLAALAGIDLAGLDVAGLSARLQRLGPRPHHGQSALTPVRSSTVLRPEAAALPMRAWAAARRP